MSKRILTILAMGVVLVLTSAARADDPRIIIVLDENVTMSGYDFLGDESGRELPIDRILAAGRYSFEILHPAFADMPRSDRVLIRMTALDRNFSTTFVGRPQPSRLWDGGGFTYFRSATGEPLALRSWADSRGGYEIRIIYHEVQALEIARESNDCVVAAMLPVINKGASQHPPLKDMLSAPLTTVGRRQCRWMDDTE